MTGVINQFKMILPLGVRDLYYRDRLGNITSAEVALTLLRGPTLDFMPRYSLLGGWKTEFELHYSLPLTHYLFTVDEEGQHKYSLNMTFVNILDDAVFDEVILRVILPEGSR